MYYKVIETKIEIHSAQASVFIEERDGKVYQVKELEPITEPKALFLIDLFGDKLKAEIVKIDE